MKISSDETFVITDDLKIALNNVLELYPSDKKQAALLPILHILQSHLQGWLSKSALIATAEFLDIPAMEVFSVASFYELYNTDKVGKYVIYVCRTTPCWLKDSCSVKSAIERKLDIKVGQTTEDGLFSLFEIECLGACVNAPVVKINNDFHEDLTEATIDSIIENIIEKESVNK
ncbi:NAD(P)H-dependent oxidoreductase subunit E [Anaplasmataceae bacterium AB001_6]|nr:NAD(P)H-dependent oxidoreductase subunit E [Anaplasmataceae bacterium AB001_6]